MLTDGELSRAYEVADVFDEQDASLVEIHVIESVVDHRRIQVACSVSIDLESIYSAFGQIHSIDIGFDVSFDDIRFDIFIDVLEDVLERCRLSYARGSHLVDYEDPVSSHVLLDVICDGIVLFEYACIHFQFSDIMHFVYLFFTFKAVLLYKTGHVC